MLAVLSAGLLVIFDGITDRLIPLFAIGAFLAFTLSQAGMVEHWRRSRSPARMRGMAMNGLGAAATGVTLAVVMVAKFTEGAWVSVLLVAGMMIGMVWVRRHYDTVAQEIQLSSPLDIGNVRPPVVIVPIQAWTTISQRALQFAMTLSQEIHAVHVGSEDDAGNLQADWARIVVEPVVRAGGMPPTLITLPSPYRWVIKPILEYVMQTEEQNPGRQVAVVVPELVEKHWYHYPLHNQRAEVLKAWLLLKGSRSIVLINVPWYIQA